MRDDDQHAEEATAQADEIFFDALGYEDEKERMVFIEKLCEGNTELRREVDSRFSLLTQVGDFLEDDSALWISAKDLYDVISNLTDTRER